MSLLTPLNVILLHAPALVVAVPLLGAFSTPLVSKVGRRFRNLWAVAILAFGECAAIGLFMDVLSGNPHFYTVGASMPALASPSGFPVRIILAADAMSSLVALISMTIAFLACLYSLRFMSGHRGLDKFYALLMLLTGGMLGLSLTGDFFTMFVFLEIASISSAGLIAFFSSAESFEAAFKYMVISAAGALFLLFGVGIIYGKYGMLNMAAIGNAVSAGGSFVDLAAVSLLVSALLMKSGSVPVHMWKPDAYQQAPPQVVMMLVTSALLSLYLAFRICFSVFFTSLNAALGWMVVILGAMSIFTGVMMALPQRNIKRMIGYSAIAEIGYVMLGVGTGLVSLPDVRGFGLGAMSGGIFHMVNDALDMGLILLVTGAVMYVTRKEDLNDVSGLAHRSVPLAVLFLLGILAISGMPPLNGFASKVIIYESVFRLNPLLSVIGILGSIMMLAVFVKVFASVFLGVPYGGYVSKVPGSMLASMFMLAGIMLFIGLFPGLVLDCVIMPATEALINPGLYIGGFV